MEQRRDSRGALPLLIAAVGGIALAAAAAAAWSLRPAPAAAPAVARFTHSLPAGQSITLPATRHVVAVSHDGQQMVYVTDAGLQLRSMSSLDVRTIRGTEGLGAVTTPVFSPAGDAIAFWTPLDRTIKRVPVAGGEAVSIVAADDPYGMSWDGDHLLFGQGAKGIMRVRADGGVPEVLASVGSNEEAHGPQLLPGGAHILFTVATGTGADRWDTANIVVQSLSSGKRTVVIAGGTDARYVPTGHLVYGRSDTRFGNGTLFAVPFDTAADGDHGTCAARHRRYQDFGEPNVRRIAVRLVCERHARLPSGLTGRTRIWQAAAGLGRSLRKNRAAPDGAERLSRDTGVTGRRANRDGGGDR